MQPVPYICFPGFAANVTIPTPSAFIHSALRLRHANLRSFWEGGLYTRNVDIYIKQHAMSHHNRRRILPGAPLLHNKAACTLLPHLTRQSLPTHTMRHTPFTVRRVAARQHSRPVIIPHATCNSCAEAARDTAQTDNNPSVCKHTRVSLQKPRFHNKAHMSSQPASQHCCHQGCRICKGLQLEEHNHHQTGCLHVAGAPC